MFRRRAGNPAHQRATRLDPTIRTSVAHTFFLQGDYPNVFSTYMSHGYYLDAASWAAIGQTKRSFFRLGYGFTRSRNGAAQMHAALCIPAVTGAWQYEGGGAFFNNFAIWQFNESIIEGHDARDTSVRVLDQSRIGRILTSDAEALKNGPPVKAMLIQNTNPMTVAPEQALWVVRCLAHTRRNGAFASDPRTL